MADKTILLVGTFDTKDDELNYLADTMRGQGRSVLTMDVSVLGDPSSPTDISKHDVAEAGGHSIAEAIAGEDENLAMQIMAKGGAIIAAKAHADGKSTVFWCWAAQWARMLLWIFVRLCLWACRNTSYPPCRFRL